MSSGDNLDSECEDISTNKTKLNGQRRTVRARRDRKGDDSKRHSTEETFDDEHEQTKKETDISITLKALSILENKIDKMNDRFDEIKESNNVSINKLREEINSVKTEFSTRVEGLSKKVETRVTESIQKTLDSKMKDARREMKKEINNEVSEISEVLAQKYKDLVIMLTLWTETYNNYKKQLVIFLTSYPLDPGASSVSDRVRNIVIRNLREAANENTLNKVNALINDGLKLRDAVYTKAERKQPRTKTHCGMIIARCDSDESKREIMQAKSNLRNSRTYEKVYIEHDMPFEERNQISNLRKLVNVVYKDRSNRLRVRGSRVVFTRNNERIWNITTEEKGTGETETTFRSLLVILTGQVGITISGHLGTVALIEILTLGHMMISTTGVLKLMVHLTETPVIKAIRMSVEEQIGTQRASPTPVNR